MSEDKICVWIFPPQIRNFYGDDSLFELYNKYGNLLKEYKLLNLGEKHDKKLNDILVKKHRKNLYKYLHKFKYLD
tara:strand:+ start:312 stop:536 length:225 start_codon:yes stop_codon:yes gene_type:complete